MSFNILYVEDEDQAWAPIESAISEYKRTLVDPTVERFHVERAKTPEELRDKLSLRFDAIIADVFYKNDSGQLQDRLSEIIELVADWSRIESDIRPIPIIAYTGRAKASMDSLLARKQYLYDIWDKNTASPSYILWRLSELVKQVSRTRPDAFLQKRIREMKGGASWHKFVVEMVRAYDAGWTERDQIVRAKNPILRIADVIGAADHCDKLWDTMIEWEPLSKAVSKKTRGHARHVINVFWLGYVLLHDPGLHDWFAAVWPSLVRKRANLTKDVADANPLEALSNVWFFAALFHDVGGIVEKRHRVPAHLETLLKHFGSLGGILAPDSKGISWETLSNAVEDFLHDFEPDLRQLLHEAFKESVRRNEPDQGLVAAAYLKTTITGNAGCYAREGGRAAALHNLLPHLKSGQGLLPVSWHDEPIACLLAVCDQLQTWDRERGDNTRWDDFPDTASLTDIDVQQDSNGKYVSLSIDYIAPRHLFRSPERYNSVKDDLQETLRRHPFKALRRLQPDWPFRLTTHCMLSGDPLEPDVQFPVS